MIFGHLKALGDPKSLKFCKKRLREAKKMIKGAQRVSRFAKKVIQRRPRRGQGSLKRPLGESEFSVMVLIPRASHIPPRLRLARIMRGALHGKTEVKLEKSITGGS